MLEVIVSFCLIGAPSHSCRDVSFKPSEAVTPFQCFTGTQIQMSEWIAAHPTRPGTYWRAERWTCRRAVDEAKM